MPTKKKGDKVLLLALPRFLVRELREANRKVPEPGNAGEVTDFEPEDQEFGIVQEDSVEVQFSDGPASGTRAWFPAYLFRVI
jgi:hypothetical protein